MKITPIDISHKSFSKKMWGADEAEVNDFLSQVASAMEELIHERNNLREQLRDKDLRLKDSSDRDSVLKSTISTAGQMVERLRSDAEREAKLIIARDEAAIRKRGLLTDLGYWIAVPIFTRYLRIWVTVFLTMWIFGMSDGQQIADFYLNGHGPIATLRCSDA